MVRIRNVDDNSVKEVKTIDVDKLNCLIKQRDQYKAERNSLIDDLSWYKAKVSRLEQIRDFKDSALKGADIKIKTLERENEKLKEELLQSDYVKASVLSNREEYKNRIIELTKENKELRSRLDEFLEHDYDNQKLYEEMKRENRELKDKIERLK